jgi:hypothetical protein
LNGDSLVGDVSDAFGVRAVAVRNEFYLLEITASAAARIADELGRFAGNRRRLLYAESVRLRAVEIKRNGNVERVFRIDFVNSVLCFNGKNHFGFE